MNKRIVSAIVLLFAILLIPTIALASGVPLPGIFVSVSNAPEGSYGLDFLLPKESLADEEYTECNTAILAEAGLSPSCELAKYDSDGYVSYLAHYSNAEFSGFLEKSTNREGIMEIYAFNDGSRYGYDYIPRISPSLKLALFDVDGNVITISATFDMIAERPIDSFGGHVDYDAETGNAIPNVGTSYGVIGLPLLMHFVCLLSIGLEVLVALCFKIKPLGKVALTTGISNLVMNVILVVCCVFIPHPLPYLPCVLICEAVAIIAEFLIYMRICKGIKWLRLLIFSVAANIVSAVVVYFLNGLLLH